MEGATIAGADSHMALLGFTPTGLCFPASEPHAAVLPPQPPGWGSLPLTRASPWVITSVGNPTNTHFSAASAQPRLLCTVCIPSLPPDSTGKGIVYLKIQILSLLPNSYNRIPGNTNAAKIYVLYICSTYIDSKEYYMILSIKYC